MNFSQTLDLSKFGTALTTKNNYDLKAVVVHQGTANVGHYITFARSTVESPPVWYRFDDEQVDIIGFESVMEESLGGCTPRQSFANGSCASSTAYMLMYELKKESQFC